jgi:hypothetical protein
MSTFGRIGGVPIRSGGLAGPWPVLGLGRLVPPQPFIYLFKHFFFFCFETKSFFCNKNCINLNGSKFAKFLKRASVFLVNKTTRQGEKLKEKIFGGKQNSSHEPFGATF